MKRFLPLIIALSFAVATIFAAKGSVKSENHSTEGIGQVAFSAGFYEGPKDIYTVAFYDESVTQLTFSGNNYHPNWSPDGCQIAFHRYTNQDGTQSPNVFVMHWDGTGETQLTRHGGMTPVWSPDGTRIAYIRIVDGNGAIYITNADGSQTIQLTDFAADDGTRGLAWSPDGRWIAFISNRANPLYDVFVIDVNEVVQEDLDSAFTNLTNSSGVCPGDYANLSWSPDGDQLVTSSACEGPPRGIYSLQMEARADSLIVVDEKRLISDVPGSLWYGFDWSPDGTTLVFVTSLKGLSATSVYTIEVGASDPVAQDATWVTLLNGADTGYLYSSPDWQPQECND